MSSVAGKHKTNHSAQEDLDCLTTEPMEFISRPLPLYLHFYITHGTNQKPVNTHPPTAITS